MRVPFLRTVGLLAAVLIAFGVVAAAPGVSSAQLLKRWHDPCVPCPTAPMTGPVGQPAASGGTGAKEAAGAVTPAENAPSPPSMPPADLFAQSGAGAASGPGSSAPNMIGDAFGATPSPSRILLPSFNVGGTLGFLASTSGPPLVFPSSGSLNSATNSLVLLDTSFYDSQGHRINVDAGSSWQFSGGNLTSANASELKSIQSAFPNTIVVFNSGTAGNSEGNFFSPITTSYSVTPFTDVFIPNPGSGGVVGRTKIAEDTSPIPRDRVLFDYNFFEGVPLAPGGVAVNRFTPGFEKTFLDGMMSFEMKIPMAVTMNNTIVQDGGADLSHGEFGDLALTVKALLVQWDNLALCGGLMITVPTASDTNVVLSDGTPLVRIANQSTHLAPFLGFLWTPNERFFMQGFYQVDVEAGGCPVSVNLNDAGLQEVGTLHDTTYQYIDLGLGSWLYRGHERHGRLTGWAWTAELHGSDSLAPTSAVSAGNWRIGDSNSFDSWDLTVGTHLEFRDRSVLTLAYVDPLLGRDRQFNGEFRLMFNYFFGALRSPRAPEM
jgi:hypothetical protein